MRILNLMRIVLPVLAATLLMWSAGFGQDLQQERQELKKQLTEINAKLASAANKAEYDELAAKREAIVAKITDVDAKLKADVNALKKINEVKKLFNDALNAYKLGQYDNAVANADKAIGLDPTFERAYYIKGLALKRQRKFTEAMVAFAGCLEQNPAYSEAAVELGKLHDSTGNPDKAIAVFTTALQNNPQAQKVYYELGRIYLDKNNFNKAAENFNKATQIDPEYGLAFLSLGVALTELGRTEEALVALDNSIENLSRREKHLGHYRKAAAYNKQGSNRQALTEADQAMQLHKDYAPAAYEGGRALKELGQFNRAVEYFNIASKSRQWKRAADYEIDLIVNRDKYGSK